MAPLISVIIPNYNGAATLDQCLTAATSLNDEAMEIIVVDDCSKDRSIEIINRYPCKLIQLAQHGGASRARNIGARYSRGDILFFTDADCLLQKETLQQVRHSLSSADSKTIIGGTYTPLPCDKRFFSRFQSVFIHYSETRNAREPDYVATHALTIKADTFLESGGFDEHLLWPILEDVEFSHRLRRAGIKLVLEPAILVQHIFNFSLLDSLRNAIRKSHYWTLYSLGNHDLFADSGTASVELKFNVCTFFVCVWLLLMAAGGDVPALFAATVLVSVNLYLNRKLLKAFHEANGPLFSLGSTLYYLAVYPLPVGAGAAAGLARFLWSGGHKGKPLRCTHH
ncbi:MAG: glycosyltransferase [Gammaproteobacteria bacterium]